MKIYDTENKRVLSNVTLFLSPLELLELAKSANDLAQNIKKHHHHINDSDFANEITIAVYTAENLNTFDEESRKVIVGS